MPEPVGQTFDFLMVHMHSYFEHLRPSRLGGRPGINYLEDVAGLSQSSKRISPMLASPDATKLSSPGFMPKYRAFGSTITSRESFRARKPRRINSSKRNRSGPPT